MLRVATYNVEWFTNLFNDNGRLLEDGGWSARQDVTREQQIAALGTVFTALDADLVLVVEAPDSSGKRDGVRALESFAARFSLRACRALQGFANDTQQEILLLRRQVELLKQRQDELAATRADAPAEPVSEKPPHY